MILRIPAVSSRSHRRLAFAVLVTASFSLAQDDRAGVQPDPQSEIRRVEKPVYPFEVWHADYPVPLDLPLPNPAPVYQRSKRQALEKIVANLQGNTRREVWLMATEFFDRAPDDAVEVLTALMDRSLGQPLMIDVVRNAIEAMGRMGRPEFDEPLRRALEHSDASVQQAAFTALSTSGTLETLRWAAGQFLPGMDGRARAAWLRAVRVRLPAEVGKYYRALLETDVAPPVRELLVKEAVQLPPKEAAEVLRPMWDTANGDLKAQIAGVLHGAGDAAGTAWLHAALHSEDLVLVVRALDHLKGREPGPLRDRVLELSTHARPEIRLGVAKVLATIDGEDVTRVFEVCAGAEELIETKSIALRELARRGRPEAIDSLLDSLETATGSRQQLVLRMLGQTGHPRCVDVFRERFLKAPPEEGRAFLVGIALSRAPNAPRALFDLFLQDPRPVSKPDGGGNVLDTRNYVPILLPNLRGTEAQLLAFWPEIPKADYVRRASYLHALTGIAVEREDPALAAPVAALLRTVLFDVTELPQLRIQALNSLTRSWLDLDDVRKLTRLQDGSNQQESASMRATVKDFLFEYF